MRLLHVTLLAALAFTACSKDDDTPSTTAGGGPVTGAADTHCTVPTKKVVTVDKAMCSPAGDAGMDGGASMDGGMTSDAGMEEEAPVMYGSAGDDDDCKYHMEWSITPTHVNEDETVTLTLTTLADGKPATGAAPELEVFLTDSHPAAKLGDEATEVSPGKYQIKGLRFDASGKWTMRFHVFDSCADSETSPHGHAAFFVNVP